jgi:hypothetical protein
MTDGTTAVLSKLAAVLDMDAEGILAQSLRGLVAEQMAQSQQRISQLSVEHQRFLRKYGMPLEAFMRALEALEEQPSEATIHGGPITQNGRDGIRLGSGTLLPGRSTATIGLDDEALLELSQNGGAGLLVVNDGFGSEAQIDSRQIVFEGNASGDMVGDVCDVAAGPC